MLFSLLSISLNLSLFICKTTPLFDVVTYFKKSIYFYSVSSFRQRIIWACFTRSFLFKMSMRVSRKMFVTPFAMYAIIVYSHTDIIVAF
jgi:hypothetical protein